MTDESPPTGKDAALQALRGPLTVLTHLLVFALACMVEGRTERAGLEGYLGEAMPDSLWLEIQGLAHEGERFELAELAENDAVELRQLLGMVALACIAVGETGRAALDRRLDRPLSDDEWEHVRGYCARKVPALTKKWRELRASGSVSYPPSVFGRRMA